MIAHRYAFVSEWRVPVPLGRCWGELERMLRDGDGPAWWGAVTVTDRPSRIEEGARIGVSVRSPLGYALRVRLTVTEVDVGRLIAAASEGHLVGDGRMSLEPVTAEETCIRFEWNVETQRAWMNATEPVLRPLFERAHAAVMAAGERGLLRALERGRQREVR